MTDDEKREQWAAMLEADPALAAAWTKFQTTLETKARQIKAGETPKTGDLRAAVAEVYAQCGDGQTEH